MDEEDYDALTEEQKIQFDRELLQALRERKKRLVLCPQTGKGGEVLCKIVSLAETGEPLPVRVDHTDQDGLTGPASATQSMFQGRAVWILGLQLCLGANRTILYPFPEDTA